MWHVYILECRDKTLYIGATKDLTKRLDKHNKGKASRYTRGRVPVKLVYEESHPDKISALKREYQLKRRSRAEKKILIKTGKQKFCDLAGQETRSAWLTPNYSLEL
ncbi:MAG: GIY-YIG nuclease family protein [Nitrospirae bacterium]|nr:GIY-YIG nuclease family protein [Nitrospirota bacterium]